MSGCNGTSFWKSCAWFTALYVHSTHIPHRYSTTCRTGITFVTHFGSAKTTHHHLGCIFSLCCCGSVSHPPSIHPTQGGRKRRERMGGAQISYPLVHLSSSLLPLLPFSSSFFIPLLSSSVARWQPTESHVCLCVFPPCLWDGKESLVCRGMTMSHWH